MLSKLDDYPIHQTSRPVAIPASSDRNRYDRYWFNGYRDDGELYFGIGAALYPNLNIMDCGLSIVCDGRQHSFHASRRAPQEPTDLTVGPFRIEILEPMRSLRVILDDNQTGISGELEWIARTANFAEGHQHLRAGRTLMEATRFNQFGFWSGELHFAGEQLRIDPQHVYGTKDRSWGIRPVGDPDPGGAPPTAAPQIFFLWAPIHWKDRCTHAMVFENEYGESWHWDGMVMPVYGSPGAIPGVEDPDMQPMAGMRHELEYIPGTRRARRGVLTHIERGGVHRQVDFEAVLCFRMKGIGYTHPEWGHGKWKGELAMGGEVWACDALDEMALENQHIQQVVKVQSDGQEGIGVLEQICFGPHATYGFKEFLDPAS